MPYQYLYLLLLELNKAFVIGADPLGAALFDLAGDFTVGFPLLSNARPSPLPF
jgi:hypothetical protein